MTCLNDIERGYLRAIVARHDPALMSLVEKIEVARLSDDEREALREAIADEFTRVGLQADGEPNTKGLELESLIDKLGHV